MTSPMDLDRAIAVWLRISGPSAPDAFSVDQALAAARRRDQRSRLASWLTGPVDWPGSSRRLRRVPAAGRAVVIAAAALALIAAGLLGAGRAPVSPNPSVPSGPTTKPTVTIRRVIAQSYPRTSPTLALSNEYRAATGGLVVIAGGFLDTPANRQDGATQGRTELFDPATLELWSVGSQYPNGTGPAVVLGDGTVLMQRFQDNGSPYSSSLLYDLRAQTVSDLTVDATSHLVAPTLTRLADDRVLVAGGTWQEDTNASPRMDTRRALLFDPSTRSFEPTGTLATTRRGHVTIGLEDGRVLVVGGDPAGDVEAYDAATGLFTPYATLPTVRNDALAVTLPGGQRVVLERGPRDDQYDVVEDRPGAVDLFDPATGRFTAGPPLPHVATTATLLGGRFVYVTSQWGPRGEPNRLTIWAGILDPATGITIDATAPTGISPSAIALPDGRILFVADVVEIVTVATPAP